MPLGFWEPLAAKGWVNVFLIEGDLLVLERALEFALKKAGYARPAR